MKPGVLAFMQLSGDDPLLTILNESATKLGKTIRFEATVEESDELAAAGVNESGYPRYDLRGNRTIFTTNPKGRQGSLYTGDGPFVDLFYQKTVLEDTGSSLSESLTLAFGAIEKPTPDGLRKINTVYIKD